MVPNKLQIIQKLVSNVVDRRYKIHFDLVDARFQFIGAPFQFIGTPFLLCSKYRHWI